MQGAAVASEEAIRGGSPEGAVSGFGESTDQVAAHLRRGAPVEEREVHAIEADETAVGGQPEVAVFGLKDRVDGVLRQPILCLPELLAVLPKGLGGIESQERTDAGNQQHQNHKHRQHAQAGCAGTSTHHRCD